MLLSLSLFLLAIPFTIVGFWKKHPVIALIIATLLAFLLLVSPGIIQTFQAMMIYGAADPQLMAGGIAQAITSAILFMFILFPALLTFQIFMRRRRHNKAKYEAALKDLG